MSTCEKCGTHYRELPDEDGTHSCPACGHDPHDKPDPEQWQLHDLEMEAKDLHNKCSMKSGLHDYGYWHAERVKVLEAIAGHRELDDWEKLTLAQPVAQLT